MEIHILRNILLTCVLVLVCVKLSFQQNDYYDYDDIDDGLTPAPRRRPTPPPRRGNRGRDRGRGRGRDREKERQRQLEAERERQRQIEAERERQRQIEVERERQRQIEVERERQRQEEERRRAAEAARRGESGFGRGRDNEEERRRENERERQLERERERQRERERERERERSRARYTPAPTLRPPPTPSRYVPPSGSRGTTDDCGCPRNVEYSINSLNEFVTTSSEENKATLDRLGKIEKQMQDFQELVEKVGDESAKWKASLRFPGLTALKSPLGIALTDEGVRSTETFKDCQEVLDRGNSQRGIYNINPEGSPYTSLAFCQDGWTIVQRRFDGSTDFYRPYSDFVEGFGNFSGEFWMGLEMMHQLTIQDAYDLRIDLESHSGKFYYAVYDHFVVTDEDDQYRLTYTNMTAGTDRDGLRRNKGRGFSARDMDRDAWRRNSCARHYKSGFWLDRCGSDLNRDPSKGIYGGTKWGGRYVKSSLMRIKPTRSMRSKDFRANP